jgi:spore maturation protein CgeB
VTDDIEAGHQLFGDMLSYYRNVQEFEQCIHSALTKETEQAITESISRFILENHTFEHRIAEILRIVANLQNN